VSVLQGILVGLGGSSVVLLVVAFLVRSLVIHLLDKDLAAHRLRLEAQYRIELEKSKAEFERITAEHAIRFRNVYEKIADTIAETYTRLTSLQQAVAYFVAIDSSRPTEPIDRMSKCYLLTPVQQARTAFDDYFFINQIYFPADLCRRINELYKKLAAITDNFDFSPNVTNSGDMYLPETWQKKFTNFCTEAEPMFDGIRAEFRRMLGIAESRDA
jgi:hypothetical protein